MGRKRKTGAPDCPKPTKHVLVAILGTTPAVFTEAVWALATQKGIVPDEIVLFTTQKGKAALKDQILKPDGRRACALKRLQKALAAAGYDVSDKPIFDVDYVEGSLCLFRDKRRKTMEDLRSREDNLEAANMMMKEIRVYADDGDCVIHALLSGGRKTMTALFFSCVSLLARSCDRIYHVLASEKYEKKLRPVFCFPEKGVVHECVETDETGTRTISLKSEDAQIDLFEVPFVYMGEWAEQRCRAISKNLSYENLINDVQKSFKKELFPDRVILDFTLGQVEFDGAIMKPSPVNFMALTFLFHGYHQQDVITKMNNLKVFMRDEDEDRIEFRDDVMRKLPWLYKLGWRGKEKDIQQKFLHDDQDKGVEKLLTGDFNRVKDELKKDFMGTHQDALFRLLFNGNLQANAGVFDPERQILCRTAGVSEEFMEYFFPEDAPFKLKRENES